MVKSNLSSTSGKTLTLLFVLQFFLYLPKFGYAQTAVSNSANNFERVVETQIESTNPIEAKRILLEQAVDQVSTELIKEMIGETKWAKNRTLISNKVTRFSGRYIPYSKTGELVPIENGFKMTSTLRVQIDQLQRLLQEQGLFYDFDGTPTVMPFFKIVNKANRDQFAWWVGTSEQKSALPYLGRTIEEKLFDGFGKSGFYFIKAQSLGFEKSWPALFKSEVLRVDDWNALSPSYGFQIVVDGFIEIQNSSKSKNAYKVTVSLQAVQVSNERTIADVVRVFETESGIMDVVIVKKVNEIIDGLAADLAGQVLDAWQKGSIGASLYKLSIQGRLPIQLQGQFKESVKARSRSVKAIRERLISADAIEFELDSAKAPRDLAAEISMVEVSGYVLKLLSVNDTGLVYELLRKQ